MKAFLAAIFAAALVGSVDAQTWPDRPIKSIDDLIAKAKAEPGKWTLANEGPKTFGGMIARLFVARANADLNLIPYVNVGVAVQNTLGGHTDAVVADIASTSQLVKQGQL